MIIKRILLTGDDGYNSIGIRLLIRALRKKYQLHVAATKDQQSGVGGKLSLTNTKSNWGETEVDGIPAIWVDGSPADMMELAQGYFKEPFDLVISGVNLGANASSAIISSGTYSAAVRSLGLNIAPVAIAISWDAPSKLWLKSHSEIENLTQYHAYPGDVLSLLLEACITEKLWGVQLLNINLPKMPTHNVRFTKVMKDITKYFSYPVDIDFKTHTFSYGREPYNIQEDNLRYDVAAINQGYISISPCAFEMTHFQTFERLENTELKL